MDKGLVTLIGMSIAYVASFAGLGLAWQHLPPEMREVLRGLQQFSYLWRGLTPLR